MSGVELRRLVVADAEASVALRAEMLADSPFAFLASPEDDRGLELETVRQRLADEVSASFGAFEGGALVGTVGLYRDHHAKAAHKLWIWGMYVTPAARGRGLGRALMQAALEFARGIPGIEQVVLSVSARAGGARRLYESLGFRAWGTEPRALKLDGGHADEVHMVKFLP